MSVAAPQTRAVPVTHALRFARVRSAQVGIAIALFVLLVALFGPFFAHDPPSAIYGRPFASPSPAHPLGLDFNGRDVLSRVLWGGRSLIGYALLATVLAYVMGLAAGLVAGYARGLLDPAVMRFVDFLLAFPPLLFLLVLLTGTGPSPAALIFGVAIVQAPGIARIIRSATLDVSVRGYIESAVARGERLSWILTREIAPNIAGTVFADLGVRITGTIILIASVSFLGFGLQPPAADWALMVSENQAGIAQQPWAVAAPVAMIAAATIATNLISDAISRTLGTSDVSGVVR
jgi:ABC-type dipeptide/oligopeptide/nickel transport system permease subunit